MGKIKKIGVLTSGGDAPGMNACIRAVVRQGIHCKVGVKGIFRGYDGLIDGEIKEFSSHDVSNIIQRGGTILKSARSPRFFNVEDRIRAHQVLLKEEINGLIVIGGDGTFMGAQEFSSEFNFPILGIPGTIDNDLYGTDCTIGYDTALNTVVEAVDKIRDTADSHSRLFIIEVMGKDAGFIALRSGIAVGAEAISVPETKTYINELIQTLETGWRNNKKSSIILVAEGDDTGGAIEVQRIINERFSNYETRVSILGHVQRGGSPSAFDRLLASQLGAEAVLGLLNGRNGSMVGIINNEIAYTPFAKSVKYHKDIRSDLLDLAIVLSK
ncbi:MAG: 6-phosphofructokinase [Flavobacteriales bacterium]|nr:6-phosphofructokinase [Flavobacteriales bacterium]